MTRPLSAGGSFRARPSVAGSHHSGVRLRHRLIIAEQRSVSPLHHQVGPVAPVERNTRNAVEPSITHETSLRESAIGVDTR